MGWLQELCAGRFGILVLMTGEAVRRLLGFAERAQMRDAVVAALGKARTVTRGQNGTTAASHASGAAIDVYTYPLAHEACLIQVSRLWSRRDTPFGVVGAAELGTVQVAPFGNSKLTSALDPDARALLGRLRVRGIA